MGTVEFKLLTRDQFREGVFARDGHKCVMCGSSGPLDAHHIIERRLWPDGGYYLENGASVCEEHHRAAEATTLSCDDLRAKCGITKFPLPPHLYRDQPYDKWGNPIMPNGMRLRGDLFEDASVQKVIAPVLALFTDRVKYPRTWHLPWSPGATKDDRILEDVDSFIGKDCVITVKMDGENTTMYSDYVHARSIEYDPHPSRSWVKALHARIAHDIPKGWRVCGENLYAKHSIHYENLEDYFQVFSVWNEKNICLSWRETKIWAELLGLKMVPVLYEDRPFDYALFSRLDLNEIRKTYGIVDEIEGYVIRTSSFFHYKEFRRCVGKYVRANHVTTHGHWMRAKLEPNKLRNS